MNDYEIDYDEMYEADNGFDLTEYETQYNEYKEELNYE